MLYVDLIISYLFWHYSLSLLNMARISRYYLGAVLDFFSIKLLLTTLFSPWRRMSEKKKPGIDLGNIFSVFVVNTILRLVGFLLRSIVVIIGIFALAIGVFIAVLLFAVWVLWPAIILSLLSYGLFFIFS